jgi:hypothetical protein
MPNRTQSVCNSASFSTLFSLSLSLSLFFFFFNRVSCRRGRKKLNSVFVAFGISFSLGTAEKNGGWDVPKGRGTRRRGIMQKGKSELIHIYVLGNRIRDRYIF